MENQFFGLTRQPSPPPKPAPKISWDDVIGQEDAKIAIREAVEGATKHAELYKKYNRKPSRGVLLYGPPGNGKTLLAKAAGCALSKNGNLEDGAFQHITPSSLMSEWYGQTEKKISELFAKAREYKARTGIPKVLFFDEADSLFPDRASHWSARITVPTFLQELDGFEDSGAFVFLATNRQDVLDPAVVREGRIDRRIRVRRPSRVDSEQILGLYLKQKPISEAGCPKELGARVAEILYSAKNVLYVLHAQTGTQVPLTMGDFTSGAQLNYLVESAATFAITREITGDGPEGVGLRDFESAILQTLKEQRAMVQQEALVEHAQKLGEEFVLVERIMPDGVRRPMPEYLRRETQYQGDYGPPEMQRKRKGEPVN